MHRRPFLAAAAGLLAAPALVRAQAATTLKFVPYADLALLDPIATSFMTRNHAITIYDTLFALDEAGVAQPQLLEGFTTAPDGLLWRLTLRAGPRFHDGTPVLARDCVASIRRWASRDSFGASLMAATDELSAPDDRTIAFRLKRPFPLLPQALAKPTNLMAAIMPERLALTPTTTPLPEAIGSGPFRFLADQRIPGARNVYAKFEGYVPRASGTPSFAAGPRIVHFDRVEWHTMPDAGTQTAALQAGEVDWVDQPLMDLMPRLRRDRNLAFKVVETTGLIGFIRFNCLHPPFDNPAIRRVVLKTVRQREYMLGVVGPETSAMNDRVGCFTPGMESATEAGLEIMQGPIDIAALRRELVEAGYKGERVVLLASTDVPRTNAICEVAGAACRALGMNLDYVQTDWGTVTQRFPSRAPIAQGGWSMFLAYSGGYDFASPATNNQLRGSPPNAWFGWPDAPRLEELRDSWLAAPDETTRKALARDIQIEALNQAVYVPVGGYYQPAAYRRDLTGMLGGLPLMWNIRRR
ncbi:ABC transporter substrate-binding protein [Plastoroseomonas arctica]|uniref:ABC transporter substrate-binding protein n=1 Tax=Plastoroseomonas arctica TaxID=1509237 RepID=A0AAF1KK16_9PROT|nr:ABC transporter substrate-binding protein [Plastoroseomonas arctica]MBR0656190.1 ABC transporter substrate-binding protein [Plastoroseomonas arctica]